MYGPDDHANYSIIHCVMFIVIYHLVYFMAQFPISTWSNWRSKVQTNKDRHPSRCYKNSW